MGLKMFVNPHTRQDIFPMCNVKKYTFFNVIPLTKDEKKNRMPQTRTHGY